MAKQAQADLDMLQTNTAEPVVATATTEPKAKTTRKKKTTSSTKTSSKRKSKEALRSELSKIGILELKEKRQEHLDIVNIIDELFLEVLNDIKELKAKETPNLAAPVFSNNNTPRRTADEINQSIFGTNTPVNTIPSTNTVGNIQVPSSTSLNPINNQIAQQIGETDINPIVSPIIAEQAVNEKRDNLSNLIQSSELQVAQTNQVEIGSTPVTPEPVLEEPVNNPPVPVVKTETNNIELATEETVTSETPLTDAVKKNEVMNQVKDSGAPSFTETTFPDVNLDEEADW